MRVRVSIRNKVGKDFIVEEKKYIQRISEEDTRKLAKECVLQMRNFIETTSEKSTGHLASLITADPIPGGWGVGDIDTLDREAKYWNHLDKGSLGINANWNHFLPKGFWSDGRWIVSSSGYAGIKPKTPIKAHNYIAKTLALMESLMPVILKGN